MEVLGAVLNPVLNPVLHLGCLAHFQRACTSQSANIFLSWKARLVSLSGPAEEAKNKSKKSINEVNSTITHFSISYFFLIYFVGISQNLPMCNRQERTKRNSHATLTSQNKAHSYHLVQEDQR